MRLSRIVAVVLVLGATAASAACGAEATPNASPTPAVVITEIKNDEALKTQLSAFINERGVQQGRQAGALWITSGLLAVEKSGTQYSFKVDYSEALIGVGIVHQLAYLVGKFDPAATKVMVRTTTDQVVFNNKPPTEPMVT